MAEFQSYKVRLENLEALVRRQEMRPQGATHQLQLEPLVQADSQRKSSVASTAATGATDDDEA